MYYTERKPKNKKRGRPGNEATSTASKGILLTFCRGGAAGGGGELGRGPKHYARASYCKTRHCQLCRKKSNEAVA